jgi:hypothetical protein
MNQSLVIEWNWTERFAFRLFSVYFSLYILFISDFISFWGDPFPLFRNVNKPFNFITGTFLQLTDHLLLHKGSVETFDFQSDTFWGYITALSLFFLSLIIVLLWSALDKRKSHKTLFLYVYTISRYYLAFILFNYGIVKVFGNQFSPNSQNALLYSLTDLTPHQLFWSFMGTSQSYQIFAGILEITPALLLLFRRTTTIGSLIAFSVLLNVLLLNIGYDTRLKLFLFHLLIITIFLLLPDLKKLYTLFVLKQKESLTTVYPIENERMKWLRQLTKYTIILCVVFFETNLQLYQTNQTRNAPQSEITGLHRINDFTLFHEKSSVQINDLIRWKKIAVNPWARFSVQLMNDSIATYFFNSFPTSNSFELVSDNDSLIKCRLQYTKIKDDEWIFNGTIQHDSVHFISTRINLIKSKLLKDFGKTRWVY